MNEEIEPIDVAEAAREGFGPQLVSKKAARDLAEETGADPSVAESILGRCRAKAMRSKGREAGGNGEEALRQARSLLLKKATQPGEERARRAQIQRDGKGQVIDRIRIDPDAQGDAYVAELEQLGTKATVSEEEAFRHRRAFRDGFYAEIDLAYDPESEGLPFEVTGVRPLQESTGELIESLAAGREAFSVREWAYFLVQSVGLDPFADAFVAGGPEKPGVDPRARAVGLVLLRLVPLVERQFNLVELGPRQTGKSYLYEKFAPRARLLSGGKASVSKLFVDTRSGEKGLVADQDAVAFDEISSTDFQGDEVVSALKAYMESGNVNRGKTKVQGRTSIVMLGNIDEPPREILKESHLFRPLPARIEEDTALMDRIHAYLPGWEVPKVGALTEGLGLTSSYLAEGLSRLRTRSLKSQIQGRAALNDGNSTPRDESAALAAASGLLKLIYPGLVAQETGRRVEDVPWPVLRWALWMGLEARLRVRQQQHRILPEEFEEGDFWLEIGPARGERTEEPVFLPEERAR